MPLESQLGTKTEATYGTPVVVDRFFEFLSESIEPEAERLGSEGLKAGRRTATADGFQPVLTGFAGSVEFEPSTKGFGWWLLHMLGAVATTGTGPAYTHTGTLANLCGLHFTLQVNRPLGACAGTDQAFTFDGCKIAKWSLELSTDGNLKFSADLLARNGVTSEVLATASYPAGSTPISWVRSSVEIGGDPVNVIEWKVEVDQKLKDDRHFLSGSTRRAEPVADGLVEISVSFKTEFDSLALYNKVVSEVADTTLTDVVLTAEGPTPITGSVYPGLVVTLPAVRLDGGSPAVDGAGVIEVEWSGMALDAGAGPISVAYTSTDATP